MENTISAQADQIVNGMDPISLKEMDHVRLMRRVDTKFVLPSELVPEILSEVADNYKVLEINGVRAQPYHTVYYDTDDFDMYNNHHNQRLNRYKVRVREYVATGISFLEVKFKNNRSETIKKRIRPGDHDENGIPVTDSFLAENSPYRSTDLKPTLQNYFNRVTLVHKVNPERITVDLELKYVTVNGEKSLELPNLSVIEVKRSREAAQSQMVDTLRQHHIRSMGFSKYCMGTALIEPSVKTNLFRRRMRRLSKFEEAFEYLN